MAIAADQGHNASLFLIFLSWGEAVSIEITAFRLIVINVMNAINLRRWMIVIGVTVLFGGTVASLIGGPAGAGTSKPTLEGGPTYVGSNNNGPSSSLLGTPVPAPNSSTAS